MDSWIDEVHFERYGFSQSDHITIEGGFDSLNKVDTRISNDGENEIHIFEIKKDTDLCLVRINWAIDPEGEDPSEEEFVNTVRNSVRTESSYEVSHYLKSMDLPPLQSLFSEEMVVELIPQTNESDES
ncbi:MAG TPA: hypothetical protein VFJ06_06690 [Halococcus sp.]|nr:hypothetical protein [Halococcus sp.]